MIAFADLARRVLRAPARLGRTRLVAVDGPSAAGKTVFAERLADAIAVESAARPPIVHTDDLLDGWDDQFTFWTRLEERVLAPIRAGRPGRYRSYDWTAGRFGAAWHEVPAGSVLIVEGVSSARATIRPELSLAVFVDAPLDVRVERARRRDGESLSSYLREWRRREDRHFAADATAHHADVVVDGRDMSEDAEA